MIARRVAITQCINRIAGVARRDVSERRWRVLTIRQRTLACVCVCVWHCEAACCFSFGMSAVHGTEIWPFLPSIASHRIAQALSSAPTGLVYCLVIIMPKAHAAFKHIVHTHTDTRTRRLCGDTEHGILYCTRGGECIVSHSSSSSSS